MKGFILLAYNNSESDQINIPNLEIELDQRDIPYFKRKLHCNLYDNIIGYQFLKERGKVVTINSNHFIAGDIYGNLKEDNNKLLDYNSAIHFLDSIPIEKEHVLIEGNATICSIFNNQIIFQNDIERYKKVFYYQKNNILCITNYLPLLIKAFKIPWKIRKNAVLSYLLGRESKWPLTFIDEVFVLPPFSRAIIEYNKISITSKTYADLYDLKKINTDDLRKKLYERYIISSLRKSTNKTAVTLSGGYDSNCLTKLYKNIKPNDFTAVSLGYVSKRERDGNIYNETIYAEKIANKLNIPFKKYIINNSEFFNSVDDFIGSIDQPGHDPSSNFMLNKYLRRDGFMTVVNGMGGDANFTNTISLQLGIAMFNIARVSKSENLIKLIAKHFTHRGPLNYWHSQYEDNKKPKSFHDLYERSQLFNSPFCKYVSMEIQKQIDEERELRRNYFNTIYRNAKSIQEIYYTSALICNPDEYHAFLMADRNNMEISMPFIDAKAVILMMNGNHYNNANNREFEVSIFGGIDKELLVKRKSGLSIPYSEWMQPFADTIFDFYINSNYFSKVDFDILSFRFQYKNDDDFSNSSLANMILWKLFVVMKYAEKNGLTFN